jgi:uncharacterized sulfatase
MNSRRLTSLLVAILVAAFFSGAAQAENSPPNVIFIIGDDQGWTDYGFMGHPTIKTPHLDRLAREGLTLRRGYVPSSLCSPSLASILTGLYPHQHRITSNDATPGGINRNDPVIQRLTADWLANFERVPTLPRLLATKGYLSFQTGKWWGGGYQSGGFTDGMSHGDPARGARHGDLGLAIGRETMVPAFEFIERATSSGKPFFFWYAPMLPHQPHNPPARFLEPYRSQAPTLEVAKYWAMCTWFDDTCGQLLAFLERKEIADNTIVVYLADNGWIQDPEADRYAPKSKQSPYDGGLRTPIIIRWPARVAPAQSDRLATSLDLAPTLLRAAGIDPTPDMPGVNLLDPASVKGRDAIFGEIFTHDAVDIHRPAQSLRYRWGIEGNWKLIVPAAQNAPGNSAELYNLTADPSETRNVADQEPARVAHLRSLIDRFWMPIFSPEAKK